MIDEAFIIMQIGNAQLDDVCDRAFVPAIQEAGFQPRRVDRHNTGDLLKSEIIGFIERSQIIVADVTNERPNCYLEIGYAMGLGKKTNLILTAREDHFYESPNYVKGGPKVHFDLGGYDILFWDPHDLAALRTELTTRIRRRAAIVRPGRPTQLLPSADMSWREDLRRQAITGLAEIDRTGYMEVAASISTGGAWTQQDLLTAISGASIHAFGWPIGVILDNRDDLRPRPTADGILAEVMVSERPEMGAMGRSSYDLWKLYSDGRFYTLLSLHEDAVREEELFFDVRITRVTESLLLLARLYRRLDAGDNDRVTVHFRHSGLAGRTLVAANRERDVRPRSSLEDVVETQLSVTISELETELVSSVRTVVDPLFAVFDFARFGDDVVTDIVDSFVERIGR